MKHTWYDLAQEQLNRLQLRVSEWCLLETGAGFEVPDVVSPFSRLYWVAAGRGWVRNRAATFRLAPGRLYLIPLNARFDYGFGRDMRILVFHLEFNLFPGRDVFDGVTGCLERSAPEPAWLEAMGPGLSAAPQPVDLIACKARLYQFLLPFLDQCPALDAAALSIYRKYQALFDYLRRNVRATLTVGELAACMNRSYSALSRQYRADTGETLKTTITKALLQRAQQLLLTTDLQAKEIAQRLEFRDPFYFSRFIRRQTGMPPSRYRRQFQGRPAGGPTASR